MPKNNLIVNLSIDFALNSIKQYKVLIENNEFILSKQFLRSSTSIGANIHEAISAESTKDIIHKISIALKEAHETKYWLILLSKSEYLNVNFEKINSIIKILSKILISTKKN
ncbi:MAG: four helix bundle protein [Saprospiraceae bacterium]|nr:four helix bundle protein [Bacteroidia bacterium]NNL93347.1 four helix bundle protein [Saprospiraceae bacterium]